MAKANREIDKTHLSIDVAEKRGLVHRDYIAHCHRWSHVVKNLQRSGAYKTARILDIGCGKEVPLAKLLYVNKMSPAAYLGIDANKLEVPEMFHGGKPWLHLTSLDVTKAKPADVEAKLDGLPNVVVSFEMLEHVTPVKATQTLRFIQNVLTADGRAYISTPCFNGSAAENHINEMTYNALGALIEDLGFEIVSTYGTFASIKDYQDQMIQDNYTEGQWPGISNIFDELRSYYDTNVLATIFAPLYPHLSRNALWVLGPAQPSGYQRKFPTLKNVPGPWSSSAQWQTLGKLK
jgi:SAM-dependent methyltransferase